VESTELEKNIGDLEVAIDRLRSLYDQYFMGIEKLEPGVPRKDVERKIQALRKEQIRNTALRFRFQMILQRYNTFQSYWQRICRDIENGTYRRGLVRTGLRASHEARLAAAAEPAAPEEQTSPEGAAPQPSPHHPRRTVEEDLARALAELDEDFAPPRPKAAAGGGPPAKPGARPPSSPPSPRPPRAAPPPVAAPAPTTKAQAPAPPGRPAATPPPAPPIRPAAAPPPAPAPQVGPPAAPPVARAPPAAMPSRDDGLPDYRVRQLYVEYVEARRRQKESTASLTYEGLAESLRASSAKLRAKHGKTVDFEVGLKDGKAVIRPRIK
jgi:hypothetical protein